MTKFKKRLYDKTLPPTPCTEETYDKVRELAMSRGESLAEIMRASVSLFLRSVDTEVLKRNTSS